MPEYWVNVGDSDTLKIRATTADELIKQVNQAGFGRWMINAIVRADRLAQVQDWHPWQTIKVRSLKRRE